LNGPAELEGMQKSNRAIKPCLGCLIARGGKVRRSQLLIRRMLVFLS
jgi:hypothetical protein